MVEPCVPCHNATPRAVLDDTSGMAIQQRWRRRGGRAGQGATTSPTPVTTSAPSAPTAPTGTDAAPPTAGPSTSTAPGTSAGKGAEATGAGTTATATTATATTTPPTVPDPVGLRGRLAASTPVLLVQAAHPRQAVVTAVAMALAAAALDRPPREVGTVALTVLVGQLLLGWHNDLVDAERDARHEARGKPVADGRLERGQVWYAMALAVLLLVPLAVSTGLRAAACYGAALLVGFAAHLVLRRGRFSWLPWALQFACYPAYLTYGGWGGQAVGDPPAWWFTGLAALLGIGAHVLRALWGLVPDDLDGWTYLPLALGRRLGTSRLLGVTVAYLAVVLGAVLILGSSVGPRL